MRVRDIRAGRTVGISRQGREGTVVRVLPATAWAPVKVVVQFENYRESFHASEIRPAY